MLRGTHQDWIADNEISRIVKTVIEYSRSAQTVIENSWSGKAVNKYSGSQTKTGSPCYRRQWEIRPCYRSQRESFALSQAVGVSDWAGHLFYFWCILHWKRTVCWICCPNLFLLSLQLDYLLLVECCQCWDWCKLHVDCSVCRSCWSIGNTGARLKKRCREGDNMWCNQEVNWTKGVKSEMCLTWLIQTLLHKSSPSSNYR